MKVLILGATGATGRLLVEILLKDGVEVKALVRSISRLPQELLTSNNLEVVEGTILGASEQELESYLLDCDTIVSCLGHNLTLKGMFGHPRKLVSDTCRKLCEPAIKNNRQLKFILMSTSGYQNLSENETRTRGETMTVGILRHLLPPHRDNEQAADYFVHELGTKHSHITWSIVRPDSLVDENSPSDYTLHPSPVTSPIFDAQKTSRVNVAHFMSQLISNHEVWKSWVGKTPVIYNETK